MRGEVLCADYSSNTSYVAFTFNPENEALQTTYACIRNDFLGNTNTFARPKEDSKELLIETYKDCSESNWDGEGALPVRIEAFFEALRFIENLPTTISMPTDISADSSGYITMEWRKRRGLFFDIIFTGNNEVIYAGILGTSEPRGKLHFGTSIPRELIDKIQDIGI
jgi:hypothetical protein